MVLYLGANYESWIYRATKNRTVEIICVCCSNIIPFTSYYYLHVWCMMYDAQYDACMMYDACTMYVRCLYDACTMPVRCLYDVCTMPVRCMYDACTMPIRCLCTMPVRCMYDACTMYDAQYDACTMYVRCLYEAECWKSKKLFFSQKNIFLFSFFKHSFKNGQNSPKTTSRPMCTADSSGPSKTDIW